MKLSSRLVTAALLVIAVTPGAASAERLDVAGQIVVFSASNATEEDDGSCPAGNDADACYSHYDCVGRDGGFFYGRHQGDMWNSHTETEGGFIHNPQEPIFVELDLFDPWKEGLCPLKPVSGPVLGEHFTGRLIVRVRCGAGTAYPGWTLASANLHVLEGVVVEGGLYSGSCTVYKGIPFSVDTTIQIIESDEFPVWVMGAHFNPSGGATTKVVQRPA